MGKGSDWPVDPAGPGTAGEVWSGVSAAAGPAAAASPAGTQTDTFSHYVSTDLTSFYKQLLYDCCLFSMVVFILTSRFSVINLSDSDPVCFLQCCVREMGRWVITAKISSLFTSKN